MVVAEGGSAQGCGDNKGMRRQGGRGETRGGVGEGVEVEVEVVKFVDVQYS